MENSSPVYIPVTWLSVSDVTYSEMKFSLQFLMLSVCTVYLPWTIRISWAKLQAFIAVWVTTENYNIQGFYLGKLDLSDKMITLEVAKNIGI